jgi:hypothetical protein
LHQKKKKTKEDQTSFLTEFGPHEDETQKNNPPNITKVDSQTLKKIPYMLFCCY